MLEVCREIGKEMLASKNPEERKNMFLLSQTIVPERNQYLDEDMQYEDRRVI